MFQVDEQLNVIKLHFTCAWIACRWVKDVVIVKEMVKFVELNTIKISHDFQMGAIQILQRKIILDSYGDVISITKKRLR